MTRDEYDDWAYEHGEPSSFDIDNDTKLQCDECRELVEEGEELEYNGQILCESCYEQIVLDEVDEDE